MGTAISAGHSQHIEEKEYFRKILHSFILFRI